MTLPNEAWLSFINRTISSLQQLSADLQTEPDTPAPPPPPPEEDEPDDVPITPVPNPPTSRLGIGYDRDGLTMFPEPRRRVTLRDDGTGDFSSLTELNAACLVDRTIDEVEVGGDFSAPQGQWSASGQSETRPLVFRGVPGSNSRIDNLWSSRPVSFLAFRDLEMVRPRFIDHPDSGLLFERVRISGGGGGYDGLVVQGVRPPTQTSPRRRNLTLRLCVVVDNWRATDKAQGLFMFGVDDWLLEYSVFDVNGWFPPRDANLPSGAQQLRSHDVYVAQPCSPGVVRGCVFARPGSHGIQMRSGGDLLDCVFIDCPIGWQMGYHYPSDGGLIDFGPVKGRVMRCVQIGSSDVAGGNPRGIFGIISHYDDILVQDCAAALNNTSDANNLWLWDEAKGSTGRLEVNGAVGYKWSRDPWRNRPANVLEHNNNFNVSKIADEGYLQSLRTPNFLDTGLRKGFATPAHAMNFCRLALAAAQPAQD